MNAAPAIIASEIQRLDRSLAADLSRIARDLDPGSKETAYLLVADADRHFNGGGRAWIGRREGAVVGYALVMPAPGLPGLYELDGFIARTSQRQRLGTSFLQAIIKQLAHSAVKQLFHPVSSIEAPAAKFLLKNGFFVEHEEQILVLDDLSGLPDDQPGNEFSLLTFGRTLAISHFRRLYDEAFAGHAWYQPYEADREIDQELSDAGDLLFLAHDGRPIGFLWLRWPDQRTAEIEPVGLLPAYQGRGLGRQLMLAGLRSAAQQGADQVRVGAWRTNTVALGLYQKLGFRPAQAKLYLALTL